MKKKVKKVEELYCLACGFPVNYHAMIKFFNKKGLKSLSRAYKTVTTKR